MPNFYTCICFSEGNLLKEAVRRLHMGLDSLDPKRNFYDSDDDCRTPPVTALFPEMCGVGFN